MSDEGDGERTRASEGVRARVRAVRENTRLRARRHEGPVHARATVEVGKRVGAAALRAYSRACQGGQDSARGVHVRVGEEDSGVGKGGRGGAGGMCMGARSCGSR